MIGHKTTLTVDLDEPITHANIPLINAGNTQKKDDLDLKIDFVKIVFIVFYDQKLANVTSFIKNGAF